LRIANFGLRIEGTMFGRAQKRARTRAGAKAAKLHSIAAKMRGRSFEGSFDIGGINYSFTYSPARAAVAGRKLDLSGVFTVIDGRPNARVPPHSVNNVRAVLISAQGGIGAAPTRTNLPVDISTARPDLPVVESTGSLSFCGALYFKLSSIDGSSLGVPADLSPLQLNVRLAPTGDAERNLQGVYSSIVDALYGKDADNRAAAAHVSLLNKLLTAG
jgi:hypothetical protein